MIFQQQLRIPGPTPIPERVLRAGSRPMIDHRGPEFAELLADVTAGGKRVFETSNDLLVLTSSGTGGLESAGANPISPRGGGGGAGFGHIRGRLAGIAAAYGARIVRLAAEWGEPVEPADLAEVLDAHPQASLVLLTHNETSTGVTNRLADLVRVARNAGRVVAVDGVSSVSSMAIE